MSNIYFVDTETLDNFPTGVILSLAIFKEPKGDWNYQKIKENKKEFFEIVEKNSLDIEIDAKEQIEKGRSIGKSTLEWWGKQSSKAKEVLKQKNKISVAKAYEKIFLYFAKHNISKRDIFFSRRLFEPKLLEHFFEKTCKQKGLIEYYQWRDTATLVWSLTDDPQFDFQTFSDLGTSHSALFDCVKDFILLKELGL